MSRPIAEFERLKKSARAAAARSYSPYSRFPVGAAVVGEGGAIYPGCNVENASYGLTQCAERVAVTAAVAAGEQPGGLGDVLIYTPGEKAHAPCGACRQVLHELLAPGARVISCCDSDETRVWRAAEYLPDPFVPDDLPDGGSGGDEP